MPIATPPLYGEFCRNQRQKIMSNLSKTQQKEWAKTLFISDHLTQAELADKVGVSRITINKWIKTERWEELKVGITLTKDEQLKNLYNQVAALNRSISAKEEGKRFADSKEADILMKLSASIKKMEDDVGIADVIGVGRKFIEFTRKIDVEKAKEQAALFDAFIKSIL